MSHFVRHQVPSAIFVALALGAFASSAFADQECFPDPFGGPPICFDIPAGSASASASSAGATVTCTGAGTAAAAASDNQTASCP